MSIKAHKHGHQEKIMSFKNRNIIMNINKSIKLLLSTLTLTLSYFYFMHDI
jgi:hypothetical protein